MPLYTRKGSSLLISVFLLLLCFSYDAVAQKTYELSDLEGTVKKTKQKKPKKPQREMLGVPSRRALASAMLPGLGQIQNNKHWKVPVIYGGFAIFGWFIRQYHAQFVEAENFLVYMSDADPDNDVLISEQFANATPEGLANRRDSFRRERDFFTILMIAWYGLNCVDAAVDAHLSEFDVSEDLSGVIKPAVISDPFSNSPAGIGLTLAFRFNK